MCGLLAIQSTHLWKWRLRAPRLSREMKAVVPDAAAGCSAGQSAAGSGTPGAGNAEH